MMAIERRYWIYILAGIFVAALIALFAYLFLLQPEKERKELLQAQVAAASFVEEPSIEEEIPKEELIVLAEQVPIQSREESIILDLEKAAIASSSLVDSISFNEENVPSDVVEDETILEEKNSDQTLVEPLGLEKIFIDVTIQSANYLSMLDFLSEMDNLKRIYYVQSFTFEGVRENETREGPMEDMMTYSIQFYAYFAPLVQLDIPLPTPSSGQPSDKVNPIIDAEETVESDNSSPETISDSTVLQEEASKENLATEDAQTASSNANQSNQQAVTVPVEKPIKTHVVQSGETLYSISMKFYGNRNGEEIIKTANNLSGNTVRTGQVLRMP